MGRKKRFNSTESFFSIIIFILILKKYIKMKMIIEKKDSVLLNNTKLNGKKKLINPNNMKNLQMYFEMENVPKLLCIGFIILQMNQDKILKMLNLLYQKCQKNIILMMK